MVSHKTVGGMDGGLTLSRFIVLTVLVALVSLVIIGAVEPSYFNRTERIVPVEMKQVGPELPALPPPSSTSELPATAEPVLVEPSMTPGEPVIVEDVPLCEGAPLPDGFEITDGVPHMIHVPYSPNTLANPIGLVNFTRTVLKNKLLTDSQRNCLIELGVHNILKTATRSDWVTPDSERRTVLWLHYDFEFSPNPSVPDLEPGWISGLAQGGAMSLMVELHKQTGDEKYLTLGEELFNSYLVPLKSGGFTNRENGFLWFEEYPSQPPTVVNNGHFDAAMALKNWADHSGSSEAQNLFEESVESTLKILPLAEVPYPGGVMSSYDLLRGFPAAPLRLVGSNPDVSASLNGDPVVIPVVTNPYDSSSPNVMRNGDFGNGLSGWREFGNTKDVKFSNGAISIVSRSSSKATGALNEVPAGTFEPGEKLSLRWKSKLDIAPGEKGFDGKIIVQENCPSTGFRQIFYNTKIRATEWVSMAGEFEAPASTCKIRVQLMTNEKDAESTTVWFDDVTLQRSDSLGEAPFTPEYNLFVWESPVNTLTVKGDGDYVLQAYEGGRWGYAGSASVTAGGMDIAIPERFTGRNINYKYHDGHLHQLRAFAYLSDNPKFLEFADKWAALSPSEPK